MASHGEGELRLAGRTTVDTHHDEGARVEDGGERAEPGLVLVLRAEIEQDGIREMAFHELGRPALPITEQQVQPRHVVHVAEQELARTGRRARTRVEQRDVHLAP